MTTKNPATEPITQFGLRFAKGVVWADIIAEIERDQALREERARDVSEIQDAA